VFVLATCIASTKKINESLIHKRKKEEALGIVPLDESDQSNERVHHHIISSRNIVLS
jgi:hypothetical protein